MKVLHDSLSSRLCYYSLAYICFSFAFQRFFAPGLGLTVLCLTWLLSGDWKEKLSRFKSNKLLWLYLSFYLFYVLSLLYTDDVQRGTSKLMVHLPLFLLPLLLGTLRASLLPEPYRLMRFFVRMVSVSAVLHLLIAVSHEFQLFSAFEHVEHKLFRNIIANDFTHNLYVLTKHPSYFSLSLLFCLFVVLLNLLERGKQFSLNRWVGSVAQVLLFSFMVILMARRAQLLALLLTAFSFFVLFYTFRKQWWKGVFAGVLFCLFMVLSIVLIPQSGARVKKAGSEAVAFSEKSGAETNVRIFIWTHALEVIKQKWAMGAGIGSANAALHKETRKKLHENLQHVPIEDLLRAKELEHICWFIEEFFTLRTGAPLFIEEEPSNGFLLNKDTVYLIRNAAEYETIAFEVASDRSAVWCSSGDDRIFTNVRQLTFPESLSSEGFSIYKASLEMEQGTKPVAANSEKAMGIADMNSTALILMHRYNYHNQFLQIAATVGVGALLVFLSIFIRATLLALRRKTVLFLVFLSLTSISYLTESMFERQGGVFFFALFLAFFSFSQKKNYSW